jgi:uncharacterized repeat protein (TIGR03803 family)
MRKKEPCFGGVKFLISLVVGLAWVSSAGAAHERILHNFVNLPNGASPQASLIADAAGNLYGTTYAGGEHGLGAVFRLSQGSDRVWTERVIYSFLGGTDGANPTGGLIWDSAGSLYGTATNGGYSTSSVCFGGCGVVFKLMPVSGGKWLETVLYSFRGYSNRDGSSPYAALVFDSQNNLYGTTGYGGARNSGTVFELTSTSGGGWSESVLYAFSGETDGTLPSAPLAFDKAGNLYSTTQYGGDLSCGTGDYHGCGTVFELTSPAKGVWKEVVLYNFEGSPVFFPYLSTSVIVDSRGDLYGTTSKLRGSVFRLKRNGKGKWNYETLYSFAGGADGAGPAAGLISDAVGRLYGTTASGGVIPGNTYCPGKYGCGTIFELTPHSGGTWTERVLHKFSGGKDGASPLASVNTDNAGNLYATASEGGGSGCEYLVIGCGAVVRLSPARAGKWAADALYEFASSDGSQPQSPLIADGAGNLYGTTNAGGNGSGCPYGCGTLFKLSRSSGGKWSRRVLYNFTGMNGDGAFPLGNLTFDAAGNIYGATQFGGASGYGTVFKLMPGSGGSWDEAVLYSFAGGRDGAYPGAGLTSDLAGTLYGTTRDGGGNYQSCQFGCGTVFQLSPSGNVWKETILRSFTGANGDGAIPTASLIFDDGNLYGTTSNGGSLSCQFGCGTVFQLSPSRNVWKETIVYNFTGTNGDGAYPLGTLILDDAGELYGTTYEGGMANHCGVGFTGCGTVFKLTRRSEGAWAETILYNFGSYVGDGRFPATGLTFDIGTNLYGTTLGGGTNLAGTVFKLAQSSGGEWTESVVHTFAGYPSDGGYPAASLNLDAEGHIYGTTGAGGTGGGASDYPIIPGGGVVFEITP